MKKLIIVTTIFLSGCNIEVWEGKIWDGSGKTIWSHTFLDEEECKRLTVAKSNALFRTGVFDSDLRGDWNCTLTSLYGL